MTAVVLPELEALRGVEQGPNHHLDVHDHTLAVLEHTLEVEADLDRFAGERAAEVAALLDEPLADEMNRRTALRFGALLHDIAKPATRAERDGFVGFRGHDQVGAEIDRRDLRPPARQPHASPSTCRGWPCTTCGSAS